MITTTTYRKKDNGWQIIVSWKDTSGKWRQKSKQGFPGKKEAKAAEAELIASIKNKPRPIDKGMAKITLTEFTKVFLKHRQDLAPGSKRQYSISVNALQDVAEKPVNKITYMDLQNAISEWSLKPLTQRQYKSKLDVLFRAAIKPYGLIAANPMADIEITKNREHSPVRIIPEKQFQQIIADVTPELRMALLLGWYTGMRRAEFLALTWDDIDFNGRVISVTKQLASVGHSIVPYTKSHNGYRTIPAPVPLLKELKAYRAANPIRLDKIIFPNPYSTYKLLWKTLRAYDVTPHYLRHSYGTRLIAEGVDVQTVAALLGDHVQTVINTYIHYTDDMRKAAAKDIQKIFCENF